MEKKMFEHYNLTTWFKIIICAAIGLFAIWGTFLLVYALKP